MIAPVRGAGRGSGVLAAIRAEGPVGGCVAAWKPLLQGGTGAVLGTRQDLVKRSRTPVVFPGGGAGGPSFAERPHRGRLGAIRCGA
ncbi:hypothetical protein JCM30394_17280 [Deferrisoma palaeochoriense]